MMSLANQPLTQNIFLEQPLIPNSSIIPLKPLIKNSSNTLPTLNNQGYMLTNLHRISKAFVEFSSHAPGAVLDIGTAYGFVALEALKAGASVIANDMEPEHLEALKRNIPKKDLKNISFAVGHIPGDVDFEPNSLGAILASGVLHYLSPSDFILAIQNIASWLKPGGKFFFATPSPYTNLYEKFFPVFQKNQEIRKEWPGYIDDISEILPGFFSIAPKQINLLDKALIEETLKRSGFEIEETNFFSINLPTSSFLEATNILGVVARKI